MGRLVKLFVGLTGLLTLVFTSFAPFVGAYSSYGSGTQANPYRIATCAQLQEMQSNPSSYYTLVSNIDCTGTTVAPVGSFTGTFDGKNHTIANITISGTGLFADTNGATIKNLTLSNGSVVANGDSGSVVGWAVNSSLTNLHSNLTVPGNGSSWIGGLAGLLTSSTLSYSSYSGSISGGADTGGLVGILYAGGSTLTNSYFSGSLTANGTNAGGLAGEESDDSIVSNSYSAGTIRMNGQTTVGGLVGAVNSGIVRNSFAANTMIGGSSGNGAVFGVFDNPGTRTNLYFDQYLANDLDVNSLSCAGTDQSSGGCTAVNAANATPGYFLGTATSVPLGSWDFTNDWTKDASYPVLRNLSSFNAPSGIPHGGDANGDGISDSYQANIANIQDSNAVWSTVQVPSAGLCTLDATASTVAGAVPPDTGYTAKSNLDSFSVYCPTAGMTVPVTIIYDKQYTGTVLRHYNPTTGAWSTVTGAVFSTVTIGGIAKTQVTYNLTDGGILDNDGAANGVIIDPVGLASPTTAVATLTNTGVNVSVASGIAGLLILAASFTVIRGRKRQIQ